MNVSASRRDFLDYAKAIGIILVVWGHSGIGLNRYISSFHMPLFFLISGYLYSDARSWGSFVVRKVKSLYVPYFVWNALTLLLAIAVGAIAMRPDRICNTLWHIALTMTKIDRLLGATWFLATLFWVSLAYRTISGFVRNRAVRPVFMGAVCLFGAYIAFGGMLPAVVSKALILGLFFSIGVLVRQYEMQLACLNSPVLAIAGFALAMWIASFSKSVMGRNVYSDPVLFVVAACLASYGVVRLCASLEMVEIRFFSPMKRGLSFLGRHSADVMIWHFVFFKFVIALQLLMMGKPCTVKSVMACYPYCNVEHGWGFAYLLVGILGPLAFGFLLRLLGTGKLSLLVFNPVLDRLDHCNRCNSSR